MGSIVIIAPLVVAVVGFLIFIGGAGHMVHGRAGRATFGLGGGGALTIAGQAAGLIGLNMQSYSRLTYEVPLAEVRVHAVNPAKKIYVVTVIRLDGTNRRQNCTLQGDAWELTRLQGSLTAVFGHFVLGARTTLTNARFREATDKRPAGLVAEQGLTVFLGVALGD